MSDKEISFTIRAKDAASATLKAIEQAGEKVTEKLFSFKDILKDLTVAAGAFSLAEVVKDMLELGFAADKTFRTIAANLPTFTEGIQELKEGIDELANSTGQSVEKLQQTAAKIASLGVSSAEELKQTLSAAAELSSATGTDVNDTATLLIQLRREFGLTGDQALETAAKIASVSQGKIAVTELQTAFLASAPVFVKFGIDVDTGTRALSALVQAGLTTSRAIRGAIGERDADGIRYLASQATIASDAMAQMEKRAHETQTGAAADLQRVKNEWHESLEAIGGAITTFLVGPLKAVAGVLDILRTGGFKALGQLLSGDIAGAAVTSAVAKAGSAPAATSAGSSEGSSSGTPSAGKGPGGKIDLGATKAEKLAAEEAEIAEKKLELQLQRTAMAEADAAVKAVELARRQGEDLKISIESALSAATGHLAEQAAAAIDDRINKLEREVLLNDSLSNAEKLRLNSELETTRALEKERAGVNDVLRQGQVILEGIGTAGHTAVADTQALNDLQIKLVAKKREEQSLGMATSDVDKQLIEIEKKRSEILNGMLAPVRGAGLVIRQQMQDVQDETRAIQQAAEGALQLADAFGLVDHRTSSILHSVIQVATQIPNLIEQLNNLGKTDENGKPLATAGSVIGAAIPIIGGAASAGAQSGSYGGAALGGALSGAAAGAAIGSVVPIIGTAVGAILGGVGGLVAGLFGHASKLKEARKQFDDAQTQFVDSLAIWPSSAAQSFAGIEKAFADLQQAAAAVGKSVSAAASAAKEAAESQIKFNFISDLGQQYNALGGAQGAYNNQLDDINKKYLENVQTIRALGLGEGALAEAEEIRVAATQQLIQAEKDAAAAAALAAREQQQANALTRIDQLNQIDHVTDPTKLFGSKAGAYAQNGGALGSLLGGFDMNNLDAASIAQIDKSIQSLFHQLDTAPETVDTAGLSIDDLKSALLDLDKAAQDVAAGVLSAAQAMAAAESKLSLDEAILGTDPTTHAKNLAGIYGFDVGDISSQSGVQSAIQQLQDLYKSDPTQGDNIKKQLDALRAITFADPAGANAAAAAGGGGGSSSSGSVSAIGSGFTGISGIQADRLGDYMLRQLNVLIDIRDKGIVVRAPSVGPANGFGQAAAGGLTGNTNIGPINVHVTTAAQDAEAEGVIVGQIAIREINRALGRTVLVQKNYNGDISQ